MSEDEKIIEDIKEIINRCKECKFATCEQCEINWTQIKTVEHLLDLYNKEKEKNKELEEERKQFYEGELYTAKQLKNIEKDRKKYFIHKSKIEELRDIDIIDYLQFKIKELLEERN